MVSKEDKWVRIFDVSEISKHKKGFTIYKIVSMLYPKDCPDSITKVTVWKRFNEFKLIHKEVKAMCKTLKIRRCPSLPKSSYFKRFDDKVIKERASAILNFLEFVASNPALFTCDTFVNFFKTSHTPQELLSSNIISIKAKLNMPPDSEYEIMCKSSGDEETISDTDSISTFGSHMDNLPDPLNHSHSEEFVYNLPTKMNDSCTLHDSASLSATNVLHDGQTLVDNQTYPTPPQTPSSLSTTSFTCYILQASHLISEAVDHEISHRYEEAFMCYKSGIDVLLKNIKSEKDLERKEMVRRKTEKYLLRAEKIFNLHLSSESKTLSQYREISNEMGIPVPPKTQHSDLYKFKVVRIIASGMLALHQDSQQLFYVKVFHNTSLFRNDLLVLPENVPYMVKLINYYNSENTLFLVLEYCSGCPLSDYIKGRLKNLKTAISKPCFDEIDSDTEEESDCSYSDLVNDYVTRKFEKKHSKSIDGAINLMHEKHDVASNATTDNNLPTNKESKARKYSTLSEVSLMEDFEIDDKKLLPINNVVKWASQLLIVLETLHKNDVVCCDLQTKNLMIDQEENLIVTYCFKSGEAFFDAFVQEKKCIYAPEFYSFGPITPAVDWWSFGAILYELLVGMPLYTVYPNGISSCSNLKIPRYVCVEARSLLKQLLVSEPTERLGSGINGTEDIKSHPFFNNVSWDGLKDSNLTEELH